MREKIRALFEGLFRGLAFSDSLESRAAREAVHEALPECVRQLPHQWLGTVSMGCAATWGIHERCDFSCRACYLTPNANRTPPLPFEEVRAQLDTIRRIKGPGANTQITAGEVTLLPVLELARIVRYARDIGLDPMVMTHGQTFLRDPSYLPTLMRQGGLRKLSVHVDATQRGRPGVPKKPSERDLMPLREALAGVVREARRTTGLPLHADQTVTVTRENIEEIPAVLGWALRNADAFRVLGLLPAASVGRTRDDGSVTRAEIGAAITRGLGQTITRSTFEMGHPDCHSQSLFWIARAGERQELVEVRRDGRTLDDLFFADFTRGAFQGFHAQDVPREEAVGRVLSLLRRQPRYGLTWPLYSAYRAAGHLPMAGALALSAISGQHVSLRPFGLIVHHFMATDELDTPRGRERLAACTFKVPVNDELVPMCAMNATPMRANLVDDARERLVALGVPERPHA